MKRVKTKAPQYATSEDFCRIFTKELDSLYALAFLLTRDHTTAEKCFVVGLESCVTTNHVFKEWAHFWARRVVVQHAIRAVQPRPNQRPQSAQVVSRASNSATTPEARDAIHGVLSLQSFDRFVFVLAVLERYSDRECSLLLRCSPRDIHNARSRALEQIAADDQSVGHWEYAYQPAVDTL